jgi:SAM-dependent methyltransferase
MSESTQTPTPKEKTFTGYTKEQSKNYAQYRLDYHESVYNAVIDRHSSTGGKFDTLLDLGCGPGQAARALAPRFTNIIGLDPSEGMITTARSIPGAEKPIRFEISSAEELGSNLDPPIADSSVDLITASTCAHWFDMDRFWPRAAKVLKPGGSVAIWVSGEAGPHPDVPNAKAIAAALKKNREENLLPFYEPGNLMASDLYVDLPLPWTIAKPVAEFDQSTYLRKEWEGGEPFYAIPEQMKEAGMDMFEKIMGTVSSVTRWREANPDAVGTEKDVVRMLRREIERLLHEAGVEKGKEMLWSLATGVVIVIKKKASES